MPTFFTTGTVTPGMRGMPIIALGIITAHSVGYVLSIYTRPISLVHLHISVTTHQCNYTSV